MIAKTYEEINTLINSLDIEYAYYQFPEGTAVAPPFICFYYPERDDLFADNSNYVKVERLIIELYTKEKDFDLEARIEALHRDNEIPYVRYESYIDTEQLIMNTFESEVLING